MISEAELKEIEEFFSIYVEPSHLEHKMAMKLLTELRACREALKEIRGTVFKAASCIQCMKDGWDDDDGCDYWGVLRALRHDLFAFGPKVKALLGEEK